jgi:hypothetical protein
MNSATVLTGTLGWTLPVDLRANAISTGIATLKNRTLSPVVERFLACAREVAASLAGKPAGRAARASKVS